jgi:hypothetical protein
VNVLAPPDRVRVRQQPARVAVGVGRGVEIERQLRLRDALLVTLEGVALDERGRFTDGGVRLADVLGAVLPDAEVGRGADRHGEEQQEEGRLRRATTTLLRRARLDVGHLGVVELVFDRTTGRGLRGAGLRLTRLLRGTRLGRTLRCGGLRRDDRRRRVVADHHRRLRGDRLLQPRRGGGARGLKHRRRGDGLRGRRRRLRRGGLGNGHAVLAHRLERLRVLRVGLERLEEVVLAGLGVTTLDLQRAHHAQRDLVGRRHLQGARELLDGLLVFPLLRVDTCQQHARIRNRRVRFHALLAHHHRFHEPTHAEVRLGERLVSL